MPVQIFDPDAGKPPTGGGGRARIVGGALDPPPAMTWKELQQVLSAGVTGLADMPAAALSLLGGMAQFGAAPDEAAPPTLSQLVGDQPRALDTPLPSFDPESVPSLLGLPKPEHTLGNESVRALAGLLGPGWAARLAGKVVGPSRILKAFEPPRPTTTLGLAGGQAVGQQIVNDNPDLPGYLKVALPVGLSLLGGGVGHVVDAATPALVTKAGAADRIAVTGLTGAMAKPGDATDRLLHYRYDPGTAMANPEIPGAGFQTTAEVGGDTGLINLERTLRNDGRPEVSQPFVANDAGRTTARQGIIDQVVPPMSGDTPPVPRDAAGVAGVLQPQADAQLAAAQAQRDARLAEARQGVAALGPAESDVQLAGQRLQQPLVAARQASEDAAQTLFRSIDPDGSTAIATKPIRDAAIAEARARYPGEAYYPTDLKTVLAQLAPDTLTLGDLQSIRGGLRTSDQRLQGVFARIGPAIGDTIDAAAAAGAGIAPEQAAQYAAWKRAYAQHMATYGEGPVGQATEIAMGRPEMGPASVPGQFFRPGPGGADTMTAFNAAVAGAGERAPVLTTAMREHISGALSGLLNDDGVLAPAVLARWLKNHGPAISRLPADLRAQLATLDGATGLLEGASQNLADTAAGRGRGIAAAFLDGADPAAAVKQALTGPQATNNLRDLVGRMRQGPPEAMQQLRRAVLDDWMASATSTSPLDASGEARAMSAHQATKWWDKNRAVLQAAGVFSPDELGRLDLLHNDILSKQRINSVGRAVASNTGQNLSNAAFLDSLMSGAPVPGWAEPMLARGLSAVTNLPWIKGIMADTQAKGRARLAEAMLDPAVAADLLRRADPAVLERLSGRLPRGSWLTTLGARAAPATARATN